MIDPHVHMRDWKQSSKETLSHGLAVAEKAGLSGIFEMPNTNPSLIKESTIKERIALGDSVGSSLFHGIFAGLTYKLDQVKEIVKVYNAYFPRVVGLKLYAGRSTGDLAVLEENIQFQIFKTLAKEEYKGVVGVHCEKESLFKNELWDSSDPYTHCLCRTPESEVESIKDMIRFAGEANFKGTLHICHISTSKGIEVINKARSGAPFSLVCGATPHHLMLNREMMKQKGGEVLKMNPPLRSLKEQQDLLKLLFEEQIDWIETDHAPHGIIDKPLASGIPGLPFYPRFINILKAMGMSGSILQKITHTNICNAFNIDIKPLDQKVYGDLTGEYPYDPFCFV